MKIILKHSSMIPIYEQILTQIKTLIRTGELKEGEQLPSVRALSKELKISALTVKKAYDVLEEEGFTVTVHGKGSFVAEAPSDAFAGDYAEELERKLEVLIAEARRYGVEDEETKRILERILEG